MQDIVSFKMRNFLTKQQVRNTFSQRHFQAVACLCYSVLAVFKEAGL